MSRQAAWHIWYENRGARGWKCRRGTLHSDGERLHGEFGVRIVARGAKGTRNKRARSFVVGTVVGLDVSNAAILRVAAATVAQVQQKTVTR
jgi:hypothetical protein